MVAENRHGMNRPTRRAPPPLGVSLSFPNAAQPDIIRANQKDLYYRSLLETQIIEVVRLFLGNRFLLEHSKETTLLTDAIYFGLTTVLGSNTLGEEYCEITKINKTAGLPPSTLRRLTLVFLHVGVPYLFSTGVTSLKKKLRLLISTGWFGDSHSKRFAEKLANDILPLIQKLTDDYFQPIHLAIFYFTAAYYHLSNRILGLQHIFLRKLRPGEKQTGYEILGLLLSIQLVVKAFTSLKKIWLTRRDALVVEESTVDETGWEFVKSEASSRRSSRRGSALLYTDGQKCTLCLSVRIVTTSTPCGHLFCWTCIGEWCRTKPECPLCRQPAGLAQLWVVNH